MSKITIALQDGFRNDSVVITVNDEEVFRKSGVSTNLAISLAESIEATVSVNDVRLEVDVLSRHTKTTRTLRASECPYVSICLKDSGKPEITPSKEAFRYF